MVPIRLSSRKASKRIKRDWKVELSLKYLLIRKKLEKDIIAEIGTRKGNRRIGYCHLYWAVKKRILRKKYNIEWRSPAELNPHVHFD